MSDSRTVSPSISRRPNPEAPSQWYRGVFLTQTGAAQIYSLPAPEFKRLAYFYSPRNGQPIYTIRLRRFSSRATLIGTVSEEEVEEIEIP